MLHLETAAGELGLGEDLESNSLLPLSLWLDGVSLKYDRSESLEVITISLPHLGGSMSNMQLPTTALYKSHMGKDVTLDGMMAVVAWSLTSLAEGVYPKYGANAELLDGRRAKLARKPLPKALLVEVKGDWAAFKGAFRLPGWAEVDNCW